MLAGISGDSCEGISIALLNCILDLNFILVYTMVLPVLEVTIFLYTKIWNFRPWAAVKYPTAGELTLGVVPFNLETLTMCQWAPDDPQNCLNF